MTAGAPTLDSVETFARLCAAREETFADGAGVLADSGLDARGFAHLVERWTTRLSAEGAEELQRRFGDAYAAARSQGVGAVVEDSEMKVPGAPDGLGGSVSSAPEMALPQPAEPALAPAAGSDVPSFMRARAAPAPAMTRGPAMMPVSAISAVSPMSAVTLEIDLSTIAAAPVPFKAPAQAAPRASVAPPAAGPLGAVPPGKRWKRFDPQTGRPLAAPMLEDIPAAPRGACPERGKRPRSSAMTMELDPASLAATLAQGSMPFRR